MTVEKIPEVTDVQWASINQKNRKIVEEFLKESIQLSDQTLSQYTSALRIYFCYIKDNCEDKDFDKIKSKDFLLYQNYLTRRGLSSSAVRLKRAAVSSLNSYIETYYEELNFRSYITKKISAPTSAFVNEKNPPTLEEYSLMCKELEKLEMWQHLAYLKFTFSTGCRRAESIQLLKEVINAEKQEKEIKVKDENGNEIIKTATYYLTGKIRCKGKGKAGKIRIFQFDEESMLAIKKWMEIRGNDDCPYVFVSKHNHVVKQLNPATLNLWGTTIFTKLLGRRFHPHILRESRATSLVVEQGRDIKVVQKLLGHESSQTSELYVIRDDEDMSDEAFT